MKCRRCNHPSTRVVETRVQDDGITRRRRACEECGFRFNSFEIPPEAMRAVRSRLADWQSRLVSPVVLQRRRNVVARTRAESDFAAGKTIKQVAVLYGVSARLAKIWSEEYHREHKHRLSKAFAADVAAGLTPNQLSAKYDISKAAARSRRLRVKKASLRHSGDEPLAGGNNQSP